MSVGEISFPPAPAVLWFGWKKGLKHTGWGKSWDDNIQRIKTLAGTQVRDNKPRCMWEANKGGIPPRVPAGLNHVSGRGQLGRLWEAHQQNGADKDADKEMRGTMEWGVGKKKGPSAGKSLNVLEWRWWTMLGSCICLCVCVCGCVVYLSLSVTSALLVCHSSSCLLCLSVH